MNKKRTIKYIILLLLISLLGVPYAGAYERYASTTSGTDFWLTFLNNNGVAASDRSLVLEVILSSTDPCEVNIDVNGKTLETISLEANSTQSYRFTNKDEVYASSTQVPEPKGVHVYATDGKTNFSCFTYSSVGAELSPLRDMSLVLPCASLGREYVVQTYDEDQKSTEFAIVATENAMITITPSVETDKGGGAYAPLTNISLKKGDVYWVSSVSKDKAGDDAMDLSGSRICSNHPIAVFAGNQATRITPPATAFSENHAFEQILPVMWLGREFYFSMTGNAYNKQNVVKFTSVFDQTTVSIQSPGIATADHSFSETLGEGESDFVTLNPENNLSEVIIRADSPIVIMAYMACGGYSQHAYPKPEKPTQSVTIAWGNPTCAAIPAWNQRVNSMDFVIPEIQSTYPAFVEYYLQLVTTTASVSGISLDGVPVDASLWKPFADDATMSHANIPISSTGRHVVNSTKEGFVGTISGQADGQAYMYTLGYAPRPLRDSLYLEGNYMHQFPDFPVGEERLDTTYICDSTELSFMTQLAGDMAYDSLVWQVYRVDTLQHTRELDTTVVVQNTTDRQHHWNYLFALDPLLDLQPGERPAYQFYELDMVLYHTPLICGLAQPESDTLQTMIHVSRVYNDTILQRVICAGDSAACFLDAGVQDAEGYWIISDMPEDNRPTQFVSEAMGEDSRHVRYVKGDNLFVRRYHSQYGCDSVMMFYLHVCDTFRTIIDTTVCTNDTLFFDTDHFNRKRFPKGLHEWGVYFDTLKTTQCDEYKLIDPTFMGCDSIFELHLDTCSAYLFDTVVTLCTNGQTQFHWRKYDIDENDPQMIPHYKGGEIDYWKGVFYDSLLTKNTCTHCVGPCDSVYRLTLTIPNHYEYTASPASYCDSVYQDAGATYTFARYTGYTWPGHMTDAEGQTRTLWIHETNGVEKDSMISADRLTYLPYGQYLIHDSLTSQYGCDSVWVLPLTVGHTFFHYERHAISDNVPFIWPKHYDAAGHERVYGPYYGEPDSTRHIDHDYLTSHLTGCDSIYRLELVISKHFEQLTYDTICQDSTYTWIHNGLTRKYTEAGVYHLWDSLRTQTLPEKDSIYHHQLLVKPKYRLLVHDSICDCQTKYDFNGHILNDTLYHWTGDEYELLIKDSIHLDTRTPGLACDSFVTLYLHVWRSYELVDTVHVCQDPEAPMQDWHGQPYSIRVADTLRLQDLQKTRRGMACDSNYYHMIVVDPSYRVEVKDTVCQTLLPYEWVGHTDAEGHPLLFYSDTVYVDTLHTHGCHECDSVVTLRLKVMDNTNRSHAVSLCKNDAVYYDPVLRMSFNPQADSMSVGRHTYYPLVYTEEYACPYYDTLYLQINPIYNEPIRDTILCQSNAPFEWQGREGRQVWSVTDQRRVDPTAISISSSATYTYMDSARTSSGCDCDSVMTLQIRVLPTYDFPAKDTMMSNEENMTWFGHIYAGSQSPLAGQPGVIVAKDGVNYYDTIMPTTPVEGISCDSIYHLTLRVGKVFRDTAYAVICAGDTYDWHITSPITGQETIIPNLIGRPGETMLYYDSLRTSLDFDSIYVLQLYQLPDYRYFSATDTVCEGSGIYDWVGHKTFPTDTFGLFILHDSLTTKQVFPVRASGEKTFTSYTPACDSIYTLSLYIAPVYNGVYNKITDTLTLCDNDSVTWQGRTYRGADYPAASDQPKWYYDTDTYEDKTALSKTCPKIADCADSIRYLTLYVRPTSYVELPNRVICNSEDFAFGEQSGPYGDHHFEWNHSFVLPAGQVRDSILTLYDTVYNRYECDSVTRIQLTVHPTYMLPTEYDTVCQYSTDTIYTWYSIDPQGLARAHSLDISTRHAGDFVYVDSLTTISGCDSIHTLHLHIDSVYHIVDPMVTMSDEDSYVWRGQFYAGPEYARLHPDQMPDTAVICGLNYNYYKHYYEASTSCDSTHYLTLRVGKVFRDTAYAVICAGDTYDWHITSPITGQETIIPNLIGRPGETMLYYDSLRTSLDFDSIYVLQLYQLPDYRYFSATDTVCEGSGIYDWVGHKTFPTDTFGLFILHDSLTTKQVFPVRASGEKTFISYTPACDSIYTLSLYIAPVYNGVYNKITDTLTLCDNDSVTWQGRTYRGADYPAAGDQPKWYYDTDTYEDKTALTKTCPKIADCADSIRYLTLYVRPTDYIELSQSICNNDDFAFGEQSGPYGDHHFEWNHSFVLPAGQVRDSLMTLYDTVHNRYDCDSVTRMTLTVHPSYHILTDTMVCASELVDFVWRGRSGYLVDVDDYDYLQTETYGCDSTFHLHLTVIPNILEEKTIDFCEGDTMDWRGQQIYASFVSPTQPDYNQTYRAKYTTQQGCEAEAILHVRFHHVYHTERSFELCDNEDYFFHGHRYRLSQWRSPLHRDTVVQLDTMLYSIYGCDSLVTHYLTIHPTYAFYEDRTICSDEHVTIQGRTYHSDLATVLYDTVRYPTFYDCDSIYYIRVQVNQSYHWSDNQERCAQDLNFDWYGIHVAYSAEEVARWHNDTVLYFTDDHHTVLGCDSTYHLSILAHPVRYEERTDSICEGDYYVSPSHHVWRKEGTYYDTTFTSLGCPIYHTIHLRVLKPTSYTFRMTPVCANDPVALLHYEYQGEVPLSYSVLFDSLAHSQRFYDQHDIPLDPYLDYLTLEMPVPSADPMQYPRPSHYAVQIMMDNGVCRDSSLLLFPVTLEVRYPDWVIEQHWNDAIGILVPELNGRDVITGEGYSFSSYQWYRNDSILYGETRPYLFAAHDLVPGAEYSVALTREGETESVRTCAITAVHQGIDPLVPTLPFVSVTPTVIDHRNPQVDIISTEPGSYALYTSYGVRLKNGLFNPDEHHATTVELPILSGVYIIELTTQSGLHRTVKVMMK